jgi:hypothetical protein
MVEKPLAKGLIIRVGDGTSICAFDDPWIPANNMNGQLLCKLPKAKAMMVDELIDIEQMCWSEDKLEENFIETNRHAICQIPLEMFAEDEWEWKQEKNGVFSVRSAYWLISSIQQATQPSGSGEDNSTCWKKIVEATPKVRCFCAP